MIYQGLTEEVFFINLLYFNSTKNFVLKGKQAGMVEVMVKLNYEKYLNFSWIIDYCDCGILTIYERLKFY